MIIPTLNRRKVNDDQFIAAYSMYHVPMVHDALKAVGGFYFGISFKFTF